MVEGLRRGASCENQALSGGSSPPSACLPLLAFCQSQQVLLVASYRTAWTLQGTHGGPHPSSGGEPLLPAHTQAGGYAQSRVTAPTFPDSAAMRSTDCEPRPGTEDKTENNRSALQELTGTPCSPWPLTFSALGRGQRRVG